MTEEEQFAEYIEFLEWATQTPKEEVEQLRANIEGYLEQIGFADNPGPRGFLTWSPRRRWRSAGE